MFVDYTMIVLSILWQPHAMTAYFEKWIYKNAIWHRSVYAFSTKVWGNIYQLLYQQVSIFKPRLLKTSSYATLSQKTGFVTTNVLHNVVISLTLRCNYCLKYIYDIFRPNWTAYSPSEDVVLGVIWIDCREFKLFVLGLYINIMSTSTLER